eukprot:jgi/Mesvir1/18644/Mv17148-RA.1
MLTQQGVASSEAYESSPPWCGQAVPQAAMPAGATRRAGYPSTPPSPAKQGVAQLKAHLESSLRPHRQGVVRVQAAMAAPGNMVVGYPSPTLSPTSAKQPPAQTTAQQPPTPLAQAAATQQPQETPQGTPPCPSLQESLWDPSHGWSTADTPFATFESIASPDGHPIATDQQGMALSEPFSPGGGQASGTTVEGHPSTPPPSAKGLSGNASDVKWSKDEQTFLRADFEAQLAKRFKVPSVLILLGGNDFHAGAVLEGLERESKVVIIDGSGGAADAISEWKRQMDSAAKATSTEHPSDNLLAYAIQPALKESLLVNSTDIFSELVGYGEIKRLELRQVRSFAGGSPKRVAGFLMELYQSSVDRKNIALPRWINKTNQDSKLPGATTPNVSAGTQNAEEATNHASKSASAETRTDEFEPDLTDELIRQFPEMFRKGGNSRLERSLPCDGQTAAIDIILWALVSRHMDLAVCVWQHAHVHGHARDDVQAHLASKRGYEGDEKPSGDKPGDKLESEHEDVPIHCALYATYICNVLAKENEAEPAIKKVRC